MLRYIKNEEHYSFLIEAIRQAKRTVWIGTADIKDLYIKEGKDAVPLLKLLEQKVKEGVEIFDLKQVYIGSANLTGAALGMKGKDNRNFEAGVFTSVEELVKEAVEQFDCLWMGIPCKSCKRKKFCSDRIA